MKPSTKLHSLLYTLICLFLVQFSNAQFDIGFKFGYSADNSVSEINYVHDKAGFVDNSITLNSTSNTRLTKATRQMKITSRRNSHWEQGQPTITSATLWI